MESKKNTKKRTLSIRKIAMAGVLVAVAVAGSLISFPVAGSKCAPVQHMVNICAAVFFRTCMGCRCGILCEYHQKPDRTWKPHGIPGKHGRCSVLWTDVQIQQKIIPTCIAEALGTGILGGLAAYPLAKYVMLIQPEGMFIYIVPFLISTVAGSIVATIVMLILKKNGALTVFKENLE